MSLGFKYKTKPLPKPSIGLLALLGPAFIWASVAQGSGELIWWPYFAAKYGLAFVGLLLPAALIQFFVNREISRYTALTGEGIWQGLVRASRLYSLPLFALAFLSFLWFGGYASAGGTALYDLTHFPPGVPERVGSLFWAYLSIAFFTTALLFSKVIYKFIEVFMKIVTGVTIVGLLISITQPQVRAVMGEFFAHLFNPASAYMPANWEAADTPRLVTALAFAGMGGFLNLMYSYWMRDKNVGMGAYAGRLRGIKEKQEEIPDEGFAFVDNSANKAAWRKWARFINLDAGLAVLINCFTVSLTTLLAFALLNPKGIFPQGWKIAVVQAEFFESVFGVAGRMLFLIIAAAFLADTWLGLADGVARQFADFTRSFALTSKKIGQKILSKSYHWWYYAWLGFLILVTSLTMPLAQPAVLITITGVISVFAFVFYIPVLFYINHIKLPKVYPTFTKPSLVSSGFLIFTWLAYVGVAGWYLFSLV
ncbi:MAG: Nramp family divalent metal transporter [bacterium]